MLLINGALAVWNGLLVATAKIWCECVRGGTCCGGECRCDEGVCCAEVWHPDEDPDEPCGEGEVFLQWGENNRCCGCVPEVIFDGRVQANVNTADVVGDLCCPVCEGSTVVELPFSTIDGAPIGCIGRCCAPMGGCTSRLLADCFFVEPNSIWLPGCCETHGCPKSCCGETSGGLVTCQTVDELQCLGSVDPESCENACKGACCIDGELTENSPVTQAECDAVDGCWWGVGSTECEEDGFCRAPFDENCCETVTSSAQRLTFRGPRKKRCPELDGCGFQVTVTVSTGSPVYVHGGLFGSPYEACTDIVTFLLCNDEFHVTPAPCSGNLQNLTIEVCWEEEEVTEEVLRFHCCQDITYLLSNSECDCVTTLLYEGGGCTSNAALVLGGDAIIDASGTGALVLTTTVVGGTPEKTLTLTGTNSNGNTINGISGDGVSVVKEGTGLWRMNAASKGFGGTLTVTQGFLHMSNPAAVNDDTITIGDTSAGSSGVAAYLLEQGVSRGAASAIDVLASTGSQAVYLGGANTSGMALFNSSEIRMGRDTTLVAATGGAVEFGTRWSGPTTMSTATRNVTIGAPGYAGTAQLFNAGDLETTGTVTIRYGTVVLGFDTNIISSALTLSSDGGPVTLDIPVSAGLSHGNLFFTGSGNLLINSGDQDGFPTAGLKLANGGSTATVTVSGTGHQITCDVSIDDNAGFVISGDLEISGDISGAAGMTKSGTGALTISGEITYTGATNVSGGTLTVEQIHDGSPDVSQAVFTSTTLAVAFTTTPVSGATYELLGGATTNSYTGQVTLTGAGGATGTYNSSTSTLTID